MRALMIVSLYPRDMNIYGDRGNVLALEKRARAHEFDPRIIEVNIGDPWPEQADLVIGGGGQDSGQERVAHDLRERSDTLHALATRGVPMLMVCGLYQLFGHRFVTHTGEELAGIGVLDVHTVGGEERFTGNTIVHSADFGELIGFENHSGSTVLGSGSVPLGAVIQGVGNNPNDQTEGARTGNVLGTYLHGPVLPKNPALTDFLITEASAQRYGDRSTTAEISAITQLARESAKSRPR